MTDIIPSKSGIIVLTGYGISLAVSRGHLVLSDGVGQLRRNATFSRIAAKSITRIVAIGHSGYITFEAARWLRDAGIFFAQLDHDSNILLKTFNYSRDDAILRRNQALAGNSEIGVSIARYILETKIDGQANVAQHYAPGTAALIRGYIDKLRNVDTIDALRDIEGQAALVYWRYFSDRPFHFIKPDKANIPDHWNRIGNRVSPLTGSPRKAVSPFHAMLNYLYALLEIEASIALHVMGLDAGLGILHYDTDNRRSFACDVMECVRPEVDRWLLATIHDRAFRAKDFVELRDGQVRLLPSLAKELAETMPLWRNAIAPIVEEIAEMLRNAPLPSLLTQKKRSAARPQNNGEAREKKPQSVIAPRYCKRCGEIVPKKRRVFCGNNCRSLYQQWELAERKKEMRANEAQSIVVPEDTPIVTIDRIITLEEYQTEIAPRLADVRIATLQRATGLSRAYCKMIKRGCIPHSRHWAILMTIVEIRNG